jgi:hypothetical protein
MMGMSPQVEGQMPADPSAMGMALPDGAQMFEDGSVLVPPDFARQLFANQVGGPPPAAGGLGLPPGGAPPPPGGPRPLDLGAQMPGQPGSFGGPPAPPTDPAGLVAAGMPPGGAPPADVPRMARDVSVPGGASIRGDQVRSAPSPSANFDDEDEPTSKSPTSRMKGRGKKPPMKGRSY